MTTLTEKTRIEHALASGYAITPTGDGCGEVLTPDGIAYHIQDWVCDCADATYREGGTYELPNGQKACKHVLWLAQASRPAPKGSAMEKIQLTSEQAADLRVVLMLAIENAEEHARDAQGIRELESSVAHWRERARRYQEIEHVLRRGWRIEVSAI